MKSKRVFIVVSHFSTINRDGDPERLERCEFVDLLKKRHFIDSTYILDYIKEDVVKDRYRSDYDTHMVYMRKTYKEQMDTLDDEYKNGKSDTN